MADVKISDVAATLRLAKSLVKKIDVNKDQKVATDEVRRIRVRDSFTARDLVSDALQRLSWPDDPGPYDISRVNGVLEGALESLERADQDHDGSLTPSELAKASRVAKSFVEFAEKYADKSVSVFNVKPYEKPGTKAWVDLAKKAYFGGPNEPFNRPFFGSALILKRGELPSPELRDAYDALKAAFPGVPVEATTQQVNGAAVFMMHAKGTEQYDVRLYDAQGAALAKGVAKPKASDPRATWSIRWSAPD